MRRAILMLGLLGLFACKMAAPAPAPTGDVAVPSPIVGDVVAAVAMAKNDAPAELAAVAVQGETLTDAPPADAVPEIEKTPEQIRCEKDGGSWSRIGESAARSCVKRTRDAGRQCRRDRDCDGVCLARSGTCAPVTPLFGCNDVIQDDGRRMTLCLD